MSKILVYTSPARGHLYPLIPTLEELRRRGHTVVVRTLRSELERVRALGLAAEPISSAVEDRAIDDWKMRSPPAAMLAALRTFVDRAPHEIADVREALKSEDPDLLFTDINCWGAAAAAEHSRRPWAVFAPYFLPLQVPGSPPFGMGLAPASGWLGHLRDGLLWSVVNRLYNRVLPQVNAMRAEAGVDRYHRLTDFANRAPCVISYTAEPFEYPRAWPANVHLVGPGLWEPPAEEMRGNPDDRPLVLVTCSTEFQNDGALIEMALAALASEPVRVLVTTASLDPALFKAPPKARVERFVPHGPVLQQAACVVCHGGMGITQKALAAGVPVCVVPFGRDQLEVARHVEVAGAGTRLLPAKMTAERLRAAISRAMTLTAGAKRVAEGFRRAGGAPAAASLLEGLMVGSRN